MFEPVDSKRASDGAGLTNMHILTQTLTLFYCLYYLRAGAYPED